jgi:hypothetical protein
MTLRAYVQIKVGLAIDDTEEFVQADFLTLRLSLMSLSSY